MKTVGQRVKARREALGLSQDQVAKAAGIKQSTIANLEGGRNKATRQVVQLAAALRCRAQWLAEGKGDPELPGNTPATPPHSSDIVDVPKLAVKASAGNGVEQPDGDYVVGTVQIPLEFIRRRMSCTAPKNLRTIMAYGDSMADTLNDGDVIFVDVGIRQIDVDGVYVVQINGELFIKRFQRLPLENSLRMISDNKLKYEPQNIPYDLLKKVEVLGRAVWVWNGKKL